MTCYVVLRNRKTGKTRVCGQPAVKDGLCEKHQNVGAYIERLHREATESLKEPEPMRP